MKLTTPSAEAAATPPWEGGEFFGRNHPTPLFVALAADDPFFANSGFGIIESWRAAKRPVEFHLYEQGGHGFGMYPKETTSTDWFEISVSGCGCTGFRNERDKV